MSPLEQVAHLADIPFLVEGELDRKIMRVWEILALNQGSVIKLTRSAGENIDILVGDAIVAYGEIVILEDHMGVRITDFNEER